MNINHRIPLTDTAGRRSGWQRSALVGLLAGGLRNVCRQSAAGSVCKALAESNCSFHRPDPASAAAGGRGQVTLVTHDSFVVDEKLLADFEASSGLTVTVLAQGDAGAMVNQLLLTAGNPLGDVVFGIDNTFASKALAAGIACSVYIARWRPTGPIPSVPVTIG